MSIPNVKPAPGSYKKILLPHELSLLEQGRMKDQTHPNARSVILVCDSVDPDKLFQLMMANAAAAKTTTRRHLQNENQYHDRQFSPEVLALTRSFTTKYHRRFNANKLFRARPEIFEHLKAVKETRSSAFSSAASGCEYFTTVYRPVGDDELNHLLQFNQLPSTQPYQAIMAEEPGRAYAERYVDGTKRVDTTPATVIEIVAPTSLISKLFERQHKPEDGCLSHGLGFAAGKDLPLMNQWLLDFTSCFEDSSDDCLEAEDDDEDEVVDDDNEKKSSSSSVVVTPEEDYFNFERAWRIVKVKRKIPA